ncbi:MAG TPA: lipopolysaccharide biosynthesis protein [Gemmatimonadaceae bacterium]|nr:lipopolysaccharide biosynthesis protein [Gemmatimonadaceae bacterium]HRQ77463.1 lipopolysaccharide biosynthesis protein [Gemmatimonadaceae bacterium]
MSEAAHVDRSLVRGIAWTGSVKWAVQVLSWSSTLVIVRHVSPADYGIVGSATLYLGLLTLVADFGIGAAVIRLRELPESLLEQLHAAATVLGGLGTLVGLGIAIPLGWFFDSPPLPAVIAALSTTLLVAGLRTVPLAVMQRDLRFRAIALAEAGQAVFGAAVTVSLAVAGWGYWALAAGSLVQAAAYTLIVLRSQPLRLRYPRLGELTAPLTISKHVLLGQVSWWIYSNADFVVVGRVLGQAAMGLYLLAWQFASLPVEKITNVVTRVTPGVFSALQHDRQMLRARFLAISEGIAMLTLPASWGLAVVAEDFVLSAFGTSWHGAIQPLQLLSLYVALRSVVTLLPQVLIAVGESRVVARTSILFVTVMPLSFIIGSQWGTTGIATAWVIAFPMLNIPLYRHVFSHLELNAREYLKALRPPIVGTAAMTAALVAVRPVLSSIESPLARLATSMALGMLCYAVVAVWPQRARIRSILSYLKGGG